MHIGDHGVLDHRGERHEKAADEVDVNALDVGDLGQAGVRAPDERDHGEHSGDTETDAGWRGRSVQPEANPGENHNECRGYIDLYDVVAQTSHKKKLQSEARVDTC